MDKTKHNLLAMLDDKIPSLWPEVREDEGYKGPSIKDVRKNWPFLDPPPLPRPGGWPNSLTPPPSDVRNFFNFFKLRQTMFALLSLWKNSILKTIDMVWLIVF